MSPRSQRRSTTGTTPARSSAPLVIFIILLLALGGLAIGAASLLPPEQVIARGVTAAGVDLGGMAKTQAAAVLADTLARVTTQSITMSAGPEEVTLPLSRLGIEGDAQALTRAAYAIGHEGPLLERMRQSARARWSGITLANAYTLNEAPARRIVARLAKQVDRPPANARIRWDNAAQRPIIVPDRVGGKLDADAALRHLRVEVVDRLTAGAAPPTRLELPFTANPPRVTAERLRPIDAILGSYTTTYATSTQNRASNIATAAAAINGTVLLPDEEFSFNKIVGPRTADSGFKTAPVIIDGQLKPGMGGGICQVSTTLYNAALLANLRISMRSHHSLPIHYAPKGQDATVAYGSIDFRFKNSTDAPIAIEAVISGRKITMRVLGKGPAPLVTIQRANSYALPGRTITRPDPTLPKGVRVVEQKGTAGAAVTVIRVVGTGPEATRETISNDKYLGEPRIVRVGTGPETLPMPAGVKPEQPATPEAGQATTAPTPPDDDR